MSLFDWVLPSNVCRRSLSRWVAIAVAFVTAAALLQSEAQAAHKGERAEVIFSGLPTRSSKEYAELLALAGKDMRVQSLSLTSSETWSLSKSRLKGVVRRAEELGVAATTLDIDWNRLLRPPGQGLKMTDGQALVLDALKSSDETLVVGVMASLKDAPAEYALIRDTQGKVAATKPGAKVIIPFNDTDRITAVRKTVEKRKDGWIWRGEVEDTREPVMLMWWKGGKFTGIFTYRGRIYTLRTIGGHVHAVIEAQLEKLPPDHGPLASRSADAALKDDLLVSRGEAAAVRPVTGDAPPGAANTAQAKEAVGVVKASLGPIVDRAARLIGAKIAPLSAAKRRELAARKITIDVMLLYTPKVASKYLDIETDLIALSIEQANDSFAGSGLGNIKLNLVHDQQVKYEEGKGQHFAHLYQMADGKGPFAEVHRLRNEKRADVVVLIVDDASGCGLSTRVAAEAEEAYAVVHHTCAALTYSIAHEIGHIIGARHDAGLDPSSSPFPYGHGYVNGTKWRDIMSYRESCNGCPRRPYWPNPAIKIRGEAGGAIDADNARVILEQAERVSNFR